MTGAAPALAFELDFPHMAQAGGVDKSSQQRIQGRGRPIARDDIPSALYAQERQNLCPCETLVLHLSQELVEMGLVRVWAFFFFGLRG